jgi:Leucine-rich repeat (LRR) protein
MPEWTEETGFAEARRRIAACAEAHAATLDLGGLRLTRLPEELRELTWLRRLYVGGDAELRANPDLAYQGGGKIKCNALRALPGALFSALARLGELDLGHNGLTALPREIGALRCLISLDLRGNNIGPEGAKSLAALTALTSLDLAGNGIRDLGAKSLAALTALTSLNL